MIPEKGNCLCAPTEVQSRQRHDKKLGQRQRDAFADAVCVGHELVPDHVVAGIFIIEEIVGGNLIIAARRQPCHTGLVDRCIHLGV